MEEWKSVRCCWTERKRVNVTGDGAEDGGAVVGERRGGCRHLRSKWEKEPVWPEGEESVRAVGRSRGGA